MENIKPFKNPKVSVIITCFNLGKYVLEAIESVYSQKYKNFEIIVVNDCSTDNTKEILSNRKEKIIHLEKNLGQFGAFLEGLKVATGEFVCMLDADDVLLPDFLSVHLQVHQKVAVAFTSSAQVEIDEKSTLVCKSSSAEFKVGEIEDEIKPVDEIFNLDRVGEKFNIKTMDIKKYPFASWNYGPASSAVMRAAPLKYLLRYKNPKDWMKGADKIAFSFLHLIGGSAFISAPLFAYRRHSTNLSSANPVTGNFRYLKPNCVKLYIGYNKRIRWDMLKFFFENYSYFCSQFNPLNVRKMIFRIIFSFDKTTFKKILKSLFV